MFFGFVEEFVRSMSAVSFVVFIIAIVMAMIGRGEGNFYVPVMIAAGLAMHEAATVAQFILYGGFSFIRFSKK